MQVNLYTRKDFNYSRVGSSLKKQFFNLNELKTRLMLTITKKELKKLFLYTTSKTLTVNLIVTLMD